MDAGTIRVHAPTSLIFACGGKIDVKSPAPSSLRDAFLRTALVDSFYKKYEIAVAEDVDPFFPIGSYTDIMQLEADIAELSDLIILFSESYGSAAELGAFCILPRISSRLLVIIDDESYLDNSFIVLGPLMALRRRHGERAVCVLKRSDINITNIRDVSRINLTLFAEIVKSAFVSRSKDFAKHSTLDVSNAGHLVLLIVGLIQHYGALVLDEIEVYLYCLDIKIDRVRIENLLFCAEFVKWIVKEKSGIEVYYTARITNLAISFKLKQEVGQISRIRWRAQIIQHWEDNDPIRSRSIRDALARAV